MSQEKALAPLAGGESVAKKHRARYRELIAAGMGHLEKAKSFGRIYMTDVAASHSRFAADCFQEADTYYEVFIKAPKDIIAARRDRRRTPGPQAAKVGGLK